MNQIINKRINRVIRFWLSKYRGSLILRVIKPEDGLVIFKYQESSIQMAQDEANSLIIELEKLGCKTNIKYCQSYTIQVRYSYDD